MARKKTKKEIARAQRRAEKRRQEQGDAGILAGMGPNAVVVPTPEGTEKMSDILMDLIDPYWDDALGLDRMRGLLTMGMLAWNTALLPPAEWANSLRTIGEKFPLEQRGEVVALLGALMRRKIERYPENRRAMLNFEIDDSPTGPRLNVVSSLPPGTPIPEELRQPGDPGETPS